MKSPDGAAKAAVIKALHICSAVVVLFTGLMIVNSVNAKRMANIAPARAMADRATAQPKNIDLTGWRTLANAGPLVLLDIRTRQEFARGHLVGAVNIPVYEMASRAPNELSKDATIVIYCGYNKKCELNYARVGVLTPCVEISTLLQMQLGFQNVRILAVEPQELLSAGEPFAFFDYGLRHEALN